MKAKTDITITPSPFSKGELKGVLSRRLRVSWWRPSPDRKYGARLGGSVPKRGRPSSRSAMQRSCIANRASEHSFRRTNALPRAGRPHVEPTDVYSCPSQEGGYSAREARKGRSKEGGAFRRVSPSAQPPTKHAVWRRVPRLVKGASGLTHRSAQRLTPLRGRPLPSTTVIPAEAGIQRGWANVPKGEEAMEREGTPASVQRPKLRRGPVPTGPKTRPPRSHQMAT